MEWQPIATAPKMKNILLWAATDISETGEIKNWKMDTGYWSSGAQCWVWGGCQIRKYDIQPTHWQSLPTPPTILRTVEEQSPMPAPSELRQTHTYVTMDVPHHVYVMIRQKLLNAGYTHAVDDKEDELDMHGIALTCSE